MAEERFTIAVMFSAFVEAALQQGLGERLRKSAPPEVVALLDKPPLPTSRVPGAICDQFYEAVVQARDRGMLRQLGLAGMRARGAALLGRIFETTLALFGRTPDALFSNLATIVAPIVANIDVAYVATGDRAGVVTVRPAGRPAPYSYAIWEGYLLYFFEVAGVPGVVGEAQLAADQRSAQISVSW